MAKPQLWDTSFGGKVARFEIYIPDIIKHEKEVIEFLDGLLIIEAKINYLSDCIEYTAFGRMFKEVSKGAFLPLMHVIAYRHEDGHATLSFVEDENNGQ